MQGCALPQLTYPDGTEVTRGYSDRGQLATLGYIGTTIDTRTDHDGGRMTASAYNNGVSESRTCIDNNNLVGISFTGVSIGNDNTDDGFYKFDSLGRRVARHSVAAAQNTVYFQSGQQTIADYTSGAASSSPTYDYVYASYIDEPVTRSTGTAGAKHYFHRNQQYSITAITDGSGAIGERYAYSAYGTPTITDASGTTRTTTAIGNRYMYTGREWDEALALYHYRARMYDPVGGRFVSRDPIGYVDGQSLYRDYFSPADTDPSGEKYGGGRMPRPKPKKPCVRFFIGYSPTDRTGKPLQDACGKLSGSKHVSVCMSDCKDNDTIKNVHEGFGGKSRCEMQGAKYCEMRRSSSGTLGDGTGKSCANATDAEIAACVENYPEPTEPFADFTNNCHQDVSTRSSKCCLRYGDCFHVMPSCFF